MDPNLPESKPFTGSCDFKSGWDTVDFCPKRIFS